jgi:hypothetical protein
MPHKKITIMGLAENALNTEKYIVDVLKAMEGDYKDSYDRFKIRILKDVLSKLQGKEDEC